MSDRSDFEKREDGRATIPMARLNGLNVAACNLEQAANWTFSLTGQNAALSSPIRLVNAYSLALARKRPEYDALLRGPGVNLPDGLPVAWLLRRLGNREARQVRGPDFFIRVIEVGIQSGVRHYFFGATSTTLRQLVDNLTHAYPEIVISGASAPPFGEVEDLVTAEVVTAIQGVAPDIVWVGLGTPKQDFVASRLSQQLGLTCIGVGAAFDFTANTIPTAPLFMRRMGLEWLFRLLSEPRRLWRRYLVGNGTFILLTLRELYGHGRDRTI